MSQYKYISKDEGSEVEIDGERFNHISTIGEGSYAIARVFESNRKKPISIFSQQKGKNQFVVLKPATKNNDEDIYEAQNKLEFFLSLYPFFPSELIILKNHKYRLILPLLPGKTYESLQQTYTVFSALAQYYLFLAASKALDECHKKTNRILLDLKVDNILYHNKNANLIDGGVSVVSDTPLNNSFKVNTTNCLQYAPEVRSLTSNNLTFAHSSMDVYSLGYLMKDMLQNKCDPFLNNLIQKCMQEEPDLRPSLPDIIAQIKDRLLHVAASDPIKGYAETLSLIKDQYDINAPHPQRQTTPISFAAQSGSLDTFILLLKQKNVLLDSSVLLFAKQNKHNEIRKYILDPKNKVLEKFNDGTTYLLAAIMLNDSERVQEILQNEPKSLYKANKKGQTPLYLAASLNLQNIVNLLITHKNFNRQFDDKYRGCAESFRQIASNADEPLKKINYYLKAMNEFILVIDKKDSDYCQLAFLSCECALSALQPSEISDPLSDILKSIEYCKQIKDTKLRVEHQAFYEVIKLYLEQKKPFPLEDAMTLMMTKKYLAPLLYWFNHKENSFFLSSTNKFLFTAIKCEEEIIVSHLINNGFDLNEPLHETEEDGEIIKKCPLYYAVEHKKINIIKLLLNSKANTYADGTSFSAVHLAAKIGDLAIIKCFIEFRPSLLEQRDFLAQTPLLWAASRGHKDIVLYLLSKGANPNVATKGAFDSDEGRTALDWAQKGGHTEVVKLLVKRLHEIKETSKHQKAPNKIKSPKDSMGDSSLYSGPK